MGKIKFKKAILLIVSACMIIGTAAGCFLKGQNSAEAWLKKNHADVDLEKEDCMKDFSIPGDSVDKYDVYLAGELHAVKKNYDLRLALLKYYNQNAGVKYLLEENGYSSVEFINQYLETGNEEMLGNVYDNAKGNAGCSKEACEFWKKLREYNMTLPEDKRIKVVGIDIEHQPDTAWKYLSSLVPANDASAKVRSTIEKLKPTMGKVEYDLKKSAEELQSDMKANEEYYKKCLGNNLFAFSIVVDNIANSLTACGSTKYSEIREQSMCSNFKRVYAHLPKGKYFGQFGLEHVFQKRCDPFVGDRDPLAMKLDNEDDSPVKGRVSSMAFAYKDCYYLDGSVQGSYVDATMKDTDILDKFSNADMTVFKLDGKQSPFAKELHFMDGSNGGVTTDYFQYVVLIKNSRETTPYEK